jgi:hypothetical protein
VTAVLPAAAHNGARHAARTPQPSLAGVPSGVESLCEAAAGRGALGRPPEPSAAELRTALAFSRCMRAHGLSHFPDPLTTESDVATLTLVPGEYFPDPGPTEVQSPAFRQAAKTCGVQLPS